MKLTNMVIGLVAFSVIVSMFFLATADILRQNDIEGYETFEALGGQYYDYSEEVHGEDSTIRDIKSATQLGSGVEADEPDVSILKGALSAAKMPINFYTNFKNIINNATSDINTEGQTYIHPNITNGIIAGILIILVFIVLHFVWRSKLET